MGKTKTMFVEGKTEKKSGKEAYEAKMKAKAAKEAGVTPVAEKKVVEKSVSPKSPISPEPKKEIVAAAEAEQANSPVEETQEVTTAEAPKREKKAKVRSKNYKTAYGKIDKVKLYSVPSAVKLLKEINYSKFESAVELHIVVKSKGLNVNVKLPFAGGKEKKIEIADEKTIEKLKSGKIDFDILLATADMMPKLVQYARVLGPKGMMPNPKNGTLIKSPKDADKFAGNTLTLKTEKEQPVIHTVVGKLSQKSEELEANTGAVITAIGGSKQVVKAYIKSTMSPSIKLQI